MLHPAILHAGRERRGNEAEWADPKMPLVWYRQLESQLKRLAENQAVRSQWTKTVKDRAVPLLFISDNKRVVLPSSLFLLKMKHDEPAEPVEATEPEAAEPAEAAKPQPPEPEHANSRRASSIPGLAALNHWMGHAGHTFNMFFSTSLFSIFLIAFNMFQFWTWHRDVGVAVDEGKAAPFHMPFVICTYVPKV